MFLNEIPSPKGSRRRKTIVGRGRGSGSGKQSGRGDNGQKSRSGRSVLLGSEGGQVPLIRRIPKLGFNSKNPTIYQLVKLDQLEKLAAGTVVTAEILKKNNFIKTLAKPFKILGDGEIKKSLVIKGGAVSKSALEKITKAGGKIEELETVVVSRASTAKK